jgi:hypothetical protein
VAGRGLTASLASASEAAGLVSLCYTDRRVKRVLLLVVAAGAVSLLGAGGAASDPSWAGQCGIPAQTTVWGEYGWPTLLSILATKGTLVAVTQHPGSNYAAEVKARGAATYSFDLKLKNKVGTPNAPADPASIQLAALREFNLAVGRTSCSTPLIVENELFGAASPTPWNGPTAQYRANVLSFLQLLAVHGAHPVLLVSTAPFTSSSEAAAWWRAVAKVADIVREVYIPATNVWPLGPVVGNRLLRQRYRAAVTDFTSIGIPANKLGIMLSFLSQKGVGGRNGLQPASAWYQVVKWDALSAKKVAAEFHLGSVFSWGWQEWNPKEVDPTKPNAACVWLWARQPSLCDAPKMLGTKFDSSLTEGQLILPRGAICSVSGYGTIGAGELRSVQALTGDHSAALSALFARLVEQTWHPVSQRDVLAAEKVLIKTSFHGNVAAYRLALLQAHASVGVARGVLGDELRQAFLLEKRHVAAPKTADVSAFYDSYPNLLVRRVHVSPSPPWLGGKGKGYVLSEAAPQQLFSMASGKKGLVQTLRGTYAVRPLGAAQPLGSLPLSSVRPAIAAALRGFKQRQALEQWTIARQNVALTRTTCRSDVLPQPADVDLTQYLPFLRLQ